MLTNVPATAPNRFVTYQDEAQFAERPELAALEAALGKQFLGWSGFQGDFSVAVESSVLLKALALLKTEHAFDHCSFVSCSHWPETPAEAYHMVYQLFSRTRLVWIRVKCFLPEGPAPHIASATAVYPAAAWHESETFDLFGIRFDDHPDLRRLLTPGTYDEFPLRRTFPLEGPALREFQNRLIRQWNTDPDHDYQGSQDDAWMDRWNS